MKDTVHIKYPRAKQAAIIVGGLLAVIVIAVSLFDWNMLRAPLARRITAATGREAAIDGDLKVHLWSWSPSVDVNEFRLANPSWADRKTMFGAKRITVSVSLGRLLRGQLVLPRIDLFEPVVNLERDGKGRASWEMGTKSGVPNRNSKPAKIPTIRRLTIESGKLHVIDQIRKLSFNGSLIAGEQTGTPSESGFTLHSSGTLNSKPFRLEANGGPLLELEPEQPYSFSTHVTAADIKLNTHITVRKPFDLSGLDVKFDVSGDNLADLYYLTGIALPNTAKYRLGAMVDVSGTHFTAEDVKGSIGASDISGKAEFENSGDRPKLTAKLSSNSLDIDDLAPTLGRGAPRAGDTSSGALSSSAPPEKSAKPDQSAKAPEIRADATVTESAAAPDSTSPDSTAMDGATAAAEGGPATAQGAVPGREPANGGRLLPDANLQLNRVRAMDADFSYKALSVKTTKVPIKNFDLHLVLNNGLLTMNPLAFVLDQGALSGMVRIDARQEVPVTDVDLNIRDVNLGEFKPAAMKSEPLDGSLVGRIKLHGVGASVHKFAASSDGAISVVVPHGVVSGAIAELTGINVLQGLGLLVSKEQKPTEIRCGIVDFKDQHGNLATTTVYVDTSNVLITGRGNINLDNEDIKLAFQGDPKHLRLLRLLSPITLGGTLSHPAVGIKADKLAEQAGVAAALGVLLTPAAAAIAFIDPGLAKNKDCSTVLDQAKAGVEN